MESEKVTRYAQDKLWLFFHEVKAFKTRHCNEKQEKEEHNFDETDIAAEYCIY